jgi:hypothetical protein
MLWGRFVQSITVTGVKPKACGKKQPPAVADRTICFMQMFALISVPMQQRVSGDRLMQAKEFNQCYVMGSYFIYQPCRALRGGYPVKTKDEARDFNCGCIVEIDRAPYFVKTETLTPVG